MMKIKELTIIGETINYSIPRIKKLMDKAAQSGDFSEIQKIAEKQSEGASYIDINVGTLPAEILAKIIEKVQQVVDIPLCIDDPDPAKLKAGLGVYNYGKAKNRPPILNSATESRADAVFSFKKKKEFGVILLVSERMEGASLHHNSTAKEIFDTAKRLFTRAQECGFQSEEIYIDPGMVSIAGDSEGRANVTLDALEMINTDPAMRNVHKILGLSNFTFGLPPYIAPHLQNAFLTLAMEHGLDTIIGNTSRTYSITDENNEYLKGLQKVLDAKGFDRQMILKELY